MSTRRAAPLRHLAWACCAAGVVTAATPAVRASEYVDTEVTEAEKTEEYETPLGQGAKLRKKTLERRRSYFRNAPPFLRDTKASLHSRGYWLTRAQPDGERRETLSYGAALRVETGLLAERLKFGFGLFSAQRAYGPEDRDGLRMLRPRQTAITVLGEAWADLSLTETTSVRAYRQSLFLPYLNQHDIRMVPITHEAYLLHHQTERFELYAGHVTRIKKRDSRQFESMAEAAGADLERGLTLLGALWRPVEGLAVGFIDLYAWDVYNVFYAEVGYERALWGDWSLTLNSQFTHQTSVGAEALDGGSFTTQHYGVKAELLWNGWRFALIGTATGDGAAIRSPWGGKPVYLSMMVQNFDSAGESAWGADLGFDFGSVGLDDWSGFVRFARGTGSEDLATRWEYNVTLDYRPPDGLLQNFWLRLRFANYERRGSERTARDVRVILNYEIPLL